MAVTHTQTIIAMAIVQSNSDNIVARVNVNTNSVDDSNPSELTFDSQEEFKIDVSGGSSASGFVAYESLTEDVVLGWLSTQLAASSMKTKNKLSKFEWVKKNIVIVPVVAAILAGTFTSVRYVLSLTDTIEANKQTIINLQRDLTVAEDKLTEVATRLSAAEATWEMAENLYRQLADQVREHAYDIKDLNR